MVRRCTSTGLGGCYDSSLEVPSVSWILIFEGILIRVFFFNGEEVEGRRGGTWCRIAPAVNLARMSEALGSRESDVLFFQI